MISKQTKIVISEHALIQKVSDEMVILDAESGQYYTLNELATEILEQFTQGCNLGEVLAYICEQYDVSEQEAQADITEIVNTLIDKKLVTLG